MFSPINHPSIQYEVRTFAYVTNYSKNVQSDSFCPHDQINYSFQAVITVHLRLVATTPVVVSSTIIITSTTTAVAATTIIVAYLSMKR